MATRPRRSPRRPADDPREPTDEAPFDPGAPVRRGPLTDFSDASTPAEDGSRGDGFGEAPQASFDAAGEVAGPISGWAGAIARGTETKAERAADAGDPPQKEAGEADSADAADADPSGATLGQPAAGPDGAPGKRRGAPEARRGDKDKPAKARSADGAGGKPMKSARGTSMGGTTDPRERAAAGLNPVAGMDVSLEDAKGLPEGGVTATVEALTKLIS